MRVGSKGSQEYFALNIFAKKGETLRMSVLLGHGAKLYVHYTSM